MYLSDKAFLGSSPSNKKKKVLKVLNVVLNITSSWRNSFKPYYRYLEKLYRNLVLGDCFVTFKCDLGV